MGRVIAGWDLAIPRLSLGEKAILKIPSVLAYGEESHDEAAVPSTLSPRWPELDVKMLSFYVLPISCVLIGETGVTGHIQPHSDLDFEVRLSRCQLETVLVVQPIYTR